MPGIPLMAPLIMLGVYLWNFLKIFGWTYARVNQFNRRNYKIGDDFTGFEGEMIGLDSEWQAMLLTVFGLFASVSLTIILEAAIMGALK